MEGKQLFDYETAENKEKDQEKSNAETFLKVIQILLSIIMGAMHV